jgi:hypothetical protein
MKRHDSIAMLSSVLASVVCWPPTAAAEPAPRPNILFIIFDDWGWQHAGAYGCTWVNTPNFDRVAREGVLFKNCFTSNPKCSPCKSLGGYYYELAFGKRPVDMLFRLTDDPECVRNLANDPALTHVMGQLRTRMLEMLLEEQDPRALGEGAIFDTYKYVAGRQKAYDTWLKAQESKLAETVESKAKDTPKKKQ